MYSYILSFYFFFLVDKVPVVAPYLQYPYVKWELHDVTHAECHIPVPDISFFHSPAREIK
jgi:hypothetical protein